MNKKQIKNLLSEPIIWILFIGFIIRILMASLQPIWIDEASTWYVAKNTSYFNLILGKYNNEPHPPINYLLIKPLVSFFDTNAIAIRYFAILTGSLLIPAVFYFAKMFLSNKRALLAAILTSISPILIWYSAEARPYIPALLFCLLSLIFWEKYQKSTHDKYILMCCISMLIALFISFSSIAIVLVLAIYYFNSKKKSLTFLSLVGTVLIIYATWSANFFINNGKTGLEETSWIGKPSWYELFQFSIDSVYFRWQNYFYLNPYGIGMLSILGIQLILLWEIIINKNIKRVYKDSYIKILALLSPIVAIYSFSIFVKPIFLSRQILLSIIGLYYIVCLLEFRRLASKVLIALLAVAMVGGNLWNLKVSKTQLNDYYFETICYNPKINTILTSNHVMYKYIDYLNNAGNCNLNLTIMQPSISIQDGECLIDVEENIALPTINESDYYKTYHSIDNEHIQIICK